jgi:hypothetical protein
LPPGLVILPLAPLGAVVLGAEVVARRAKPWIGVMVGPRGGEAEVAAGPVVGAGDEGVPFPTIGGTVDGEMGWVVGGAVGAVVVERGGWVVGVVRGTVVLGTVLAGRVIGEAMEALS